jgi:hypothetical protein
MPYSHLAEGSLALFPAVKHVRKVQLRPGETNTVAFDVTPALLSFYDV